MAFQPECVKSKPTAAAVPVEGLSTFPDVLAGLLAEGVAESVGAVSLEQVI
jgi:hypothetical protein